MQILNPTAPAPVEFTDFPRNVASLADGTVAVLTNRWKCMDLIARRLSERLTQDHMAAHVRTEIVPLNGGAPNSVLENVAANSDLAVVGLANCGSCTAWSVHDQIVLIKRGMLAILLVTERFVGLADATRRSQGVPDAPMIILPRGELIEYSGDAAMESAAKITLDELVTKYIGGM
jgi:hypothetical protein